MTLLDQQREVEPELDDAPLTDEAAARADAVDRARAAEAGDAREAVDEEEDLAKTFVDVRRPMAAAFVASCGTALVVGGIFGSWMARGVGLFAVAIGVAWAFLSLRSKNPALVHGMAVPVLLVAGLFAVVLGGGDPTAIGSLVSDAVGSGRLFRPPVPFDVGWRPVLVGLLGLIGFGSASLAILLDRAKLGVGLTVPFTALALISQPEDAAFMAGLFAFVPIIAALAILYGDDGSRASELDRTFEAKRAVRGVAGGAAVIAVLFAVNSTDLLFPDAVYRPEDRPQKPRAVPLSAARDRVLFEVVTDSAITGPWRLGALDVYKDDAFQSIPSIARLRPFPDDGRLTDVRASLTQTEVQIVVGDLGDTSVLPSLAGATSIEVQGAPPLRYDPRYGTARIESGRVPAGLTYTIRLPDYPTAEELEAAAAGDKSDFAEELIVPRVPAIVADLMREVPDNPWLRLDHLRQTLLDRVVAAGTGTPTEVEPARVVEMLTPASAPVDGEAEVQAEGEAAQDGNEASPFEIVAAQALLARWAGVPSRVGFGFDGLNVEGDKLVVRPRNSAQWLEVYFEGYGWTPLIGLPKQAKSTLENDPNQRFTPTVTASDEIAVEVYVLYEARDVRLLYQRIREELAYFGPWILLAAVAYVLYPAAAKAVRSRRRRQWAAERGPLAQIVVEYAELRDAAIDLNVGDDFDTALEYLSKVEPDREHEELAWLVTRLLYGDLEHVAGPADVRTAQELAESVRRRLRSAQPFSSQALGFISRASLELPYTTEIPNVRVFRVYPLVRRAGAVVFGPLTRLGRDLSGRIGRWGSSIGSRARRLRPAVVGGGRP